MRLTPGQIRGNDGSKARRVGPAAVAPPAAVDLSGNMQYLEPAMVIDSHSGARGAVGTRRADPEGSTSFVRYAVLLLLLGAVSACGPKRTAARARVASLPEMVMRACEAAGVLTIDQAEKKLATEGFVGHPVDVERGTGWGDSGGGLGYTFPVEGAGVQAVSIAHCCDEGRYGKVGTFGLVFPAGAAASMASDLNAVVESPLRAVAGLADRCVLIAPYRGKTVALKNTDDPPGLVVECTARSFEVMEKRAGLLAEPGALPAPCVDDGAR